MLVVVVIGWGWLNEDVAKFVPCGNEVGLMKTIWFGNVRQASNVRGICSNDMDKREIETGDRCLGEKK